jgi:multidrug efflux pump subunit AcrA (membrane-fusion protein)
VKIPKLRWVAPAALLLLAGIWVAGRAGSREPGDWADVERDDLRLEVEISGMLKAVDTSLLGPPPIPDIWDYKIARLAPEGSQARTGDPVLAFDTSELERRLEEKRAESAEAGKEIEKRELDLTVKRRDDELRLAEAQARQRKAQIKVDRPEELASAKDLEQARLDLALAGEEIRHLESKMAAERRAADAELASFRDRRDRADARVREIEDAIARMTVGAPRDGTVIYVSNWRDEKKKVGDSCWRGERVIEIPDLNRMKALGEMDEADAGKVAVGQRVRIKLDAHPDLEFEGKVASIWGTVQRKSWNNPLKVVRLDIELDRTDPERMRPGMRFTGAAETGRVPGAVVVPADAVFPTPDGPIAWRKAGLGVEQVRLTLGKRTGSRVEVIEGLEPGDRVSRRDLSGTDRVGS